SAVFGAVTLVFVYLGLWELTRRRGVAFGLSLFFAVMPTFWSQMLVAGSYPLNALLFASLLYLVVCYWKGKVRLEWLLFVFGLGLAHHRTIVLVTPALLYLIWQRRQEHWDWRHVLRGARYVLAPLLLYVYIPIRAVQLERADLMTASGLISFLVGKAFSGLLFQGGWSGLPGQVINWWRWTLQELTPIGAFLALVGVCVALRHCRPFGPFTMLAYLGYLVFNLNYYIGNIYIYYIPMYIIMLFWMAISVHWVCHWIEQLAGKRWWLQLGVGGILLASTLLRAIALYPRVDMSHEYTMENLWLDALSLPLAKGGAVFANWNKHTSLVYYQRVEKRRTDLQPLIATDESVKRAIAEGRALYAADLPPTVETFSLSCMGPLIEMRIQPYRLEDIVIPYPADAVFGQCLRLHGYDFAYIRRDVEGNERYLVTLYWSLVTPVERALAISVRLYAGNRLLTQVDGPPVQGYYPLARWRLGEVVIDQHILRLPPAQHPLDKRAELRAVVYTPNDLQPLMVGETGETELSLGAVTLQ
ncbi:MAG: DUF2723 domain-containing protein, partial [Chloroflexi bacterium]|nr:DUF2723 domain-containing protein [Chloroflexota bacterium]